MQCAEQLGKNRQATRPHLCTAFRQTAQLDIYDAVESEQAFDQLFDRGQRQVT